MAQQPQKPAETRQTKQPKNRKSASPAARLHDAPRARLAVTINRKTPMEVYEYWRHFANLPSFMKDLKKIEILSATLSRWTVELKNGADTTWDAEILADRPGEMISWKSLEGSEVNQAGAVWFEKAPAGRGTVVRFSLAYDVPGGKLTELLTKLTGEDPESLILTNLRRLKALLEAGEIPTVEGQPSGRDEKDEIQKQENKETAPDLNPHPAHLKH